MVVFLVVLFILAVIGSGLGYVGVELMRCAFELTGGSAVGTFGLGLLLAIAGLVAHCVFAMVAKSTIEYIKERLKGE